MNSCMAPTAKGTPIPIAPRIRAFFAGSAKQRSAASTKRLTLVATILGSSIALLDASVVSVALPSIQRSLGGGLAGEQWVTNAYLLTLGSLILLGGSLADIFGERRGVGLGGGGVGGGAVVWGGAAAVGGLSALPGQPGGGGAPLRPG